MAVVSLEIELRELLIVGKQGRDILADEATRLSKRGFAGRAHQRVGHALERTVMWIAGRYRRRAIAVDTCDVGVIGAGQIRGGTRDCVQ